MAFSGRGRGARGRGGRFGYHHPVKHAQYEDFPEINSPKDISNGTSNEIRLVESTLKLERFWKTSCYRLEEEAPRKKNEEKQIERFSDRRRKAHSKREPLSCYLKLTSTNFPAELLQGSRLGQESNKKLRWDRDIGERALEVFEKLEQTYKDGDMKAEKDGGDEDEEENEETEQEQSSDDDYNQNVEFDDDDDDWNQEEETREDYYD